MRHLLGYLLSGALIVASASPAAFAQQTDKDKGVTGAVKDVGEGAKKGAETTGKAVGKGTKKGAEATAKGAKKAGSATKKGAKTVGEKANPKNW